MFCVARIWLNVFVQADCNGTCDNCCARLGKGVNEEDVSDAARDMVRP